MHIFRSRLTGVYQAAMIALFLLFAVVVAMLLFSSSSSRAAPGGSGLSNETVHVPYWLMGGDQTGAQLGYSVATAGDVNGDGYDDVIVGEPYYDTTSLITDTGRVFVYCGSAGGLDTSPCWTAEGGEAGACFGFSVGTAGDVDGDGWDDVVIGAPYYDNATEAGKIYIYYGSSGGLNGSQMVTSGDAGDRFGFSVGTAGDVDDDGYDDVVVGAPTYSSRTGRAYVYYGSGSGLGGSTSWMGEDINQHFGYTVGTAGDVNGDGYSDVIVGAPDYGVFGELWSGKAYVYTGAEGGLGATPAWTRTGTSGDFALSVGTAGDVNGDGYDDIVVSETWPDRAYVYTGTVAGLSTVADWVGQGPQEFGTSVGTAGDVNGDGYDDVVIGAPTYFGTVFVYLGSGGGLSDTARWVAEGHQDGDYFNRSPKEGAYFGFSVGTAGDVNADGYADVGVGAPYYSDVGAAFVYYGSTLPWDQTCAPDECPLGTSTQVNAWDGGPINTRTGSYHYSQQDISIPALGQPLRFEHSYSSLFVTGTVGLPTNAEPVVYYQVLGYGWTHNYDMGIVFPNDPGGESDTLIVKGCQGSRFRFMNNADGTYTSFPGVWATLTRTLSAPYTYALTGLGQNRYIFDSAGRLKEIHDPQGQVTTLSYSSGRLVQVEDATGQRYLAFSYDGEGRLEEVRDPINRTVQFGYDGAGDLTVVTDTMGLAWTYTYTGTHLLHDVRDPDDNVIERTEYDDWGRAVRQWQGDLSADPLEIEYGATGVVTVTDPLGYAKGYEYDARGTLLEQSGCCGGGGPSSRTYDAYFNWTSVTDGNGNPTYYDFDPMGRPEVITDALDGVTQMAYDDRGHLTARADELDHTTVYTYDEYNNWVGTADALGHTTVYTYDGAGQRVAREDPLGNVTRYGYDAFGQRTAVTDTLGHVTTYGYDGVGRLITVTQYADTAQPLVTANVYDNGDNLVRVTRNYLPSQPQNYQNQYNLVTEYSYDAIGRWVFVTDTLGSVTYAEYDAAGRLVHTTRNYLPGYPQNHQNQYNLVTEYSYDALDRHVLVTGTLGAATYVEYDALGRVKRTWYNYLPGQPQNYYIPPSQGGAEGGYYNLVTEYGYDDVGNQTHVTNTLGIVTRNWYNPLNRVVSTTANYSPTIFPDHGPGSDWNLTTWYGYDEVGRKVWVTDTLKNATHIEYDALGRPVTTTVNFVDGVYDPAHTDEDLVRVIVYDDAGRRVAQVDPAGRETHYEYDALGRLIAVVQNYEDGVYEPDESDRDMRSETVYDDFGRVAARVVAADERITTTYTYDALGRLVTTTDALSGTTTTVYDVLGRRLETIDAEGHSTTYAYDALGRRVTTTDALSGTTTTAYDVLGRRVAVTDPLSHTTVYTYNAVGWLVAEADPLGNVTQYGYDALGLRTVITDADGVAVYSFYDAAGRLVETRDALGNSTQYGYDALGRQVTMTDARGVVTRYEYDKTGRLVAVVENDQLGPPPDHQTNVRTEYTYDAGGNLVAVTDALHHTTVYTYDLAGRRVAEEDPLGNVTRTIYDGHGRRVGEIYPDAGGPITVTTEYNALGWPTQVEYPAVGGVPGLTVEISYDALGHLDAVTDTGDLGSPGVMTYDYDALYRPRGVDSPTGDVQYAYDGLGQRANLIYPTGEVVTYTHDAAGRLRIVTDWTGGATVYTYTAAGRLSAMRLPNGVETRYSYDAAGRLVEIEHGKDGEVLGRYEYALDGLGNRVAVTETLSSPTTQVYLPMVLRGADGSGSGTGPLGTERFLPGLSLPLLAPLVVVALGRRKRWRRCARPLAMVALAAAVGCFGAMLVQGNGRAVAAQDEDRLLASRSGMMADRTITYTYDLLGRLTDADYSTGGSYGYAFDAVGNRTAYTVTLATTTVTTYAYDAADRLTSVGGVTYTWDERGNLTHDGVYTYFYNAAGRLVRAEGVASTLVYTYTPASLGTGTSGGLRVGQAVDGEVTEFAWDWASGLPEMLSESGNLYLTGHETLGQWDGASWSYYLPDGLGSVRQVTDEAGQVTDAREWTPYGEEVSGTQAGLGYAGEWQDAALGLQYLRARWYDPGTGRFTRRDTWKGDVRRPRTILRRYVYAGNNPVNRVDPTGQYDQYDVHFDLTLRWAETLAVTYCSSPTCSEDSLQYWMAWGAKHLDDPPLWAVPVIGHPKFHFVSQEEAAGNTGTAVATGDPVLFGAALHQVQDYFSHAYEGYSWPGTTGHFGHSKKAGCGLSGECKRKQKLIDEFYGREGEESEHTVGSREDVEAELNLSPHLSDLSDNDLIDVWLREKTEPEDEKRDHYGYNTDAYFPFTERDILMEVVSQEMIKFFYEKLGEDPCAAFDGETYTPPEDKEIIELLSGE